MPQNVSSKLPEMSHAKALAIGGVCVAMAFVLNQISLFRMPQGGSVTPASMLFVALAAYWLGPSKGILVGVSVGLLNTVTGAWFVHPVQYLLDYPLAFGALGLAGFFRHSKWGLQIGYIVGVLGRFTSVYLAGVIFWGQYAPEGQSPWLHSAIYNISYIGIELTASLLIISIPPVTAAINRLSKQLA